MWQYLHLNNGFNVMGKRGRPPAKIETMQVAIRLPWLGRAISEKRWRL
jgi:hypothetical protein